MASEPSGMPVPGAMVTPQDTGVWFVPCKHDIQNFFDQTRYKHRVATAKQPPSKPVPIERHTTRANILRFFNSNTYFKADNHVQKRPNTEPLRPAAKARMTRAELLEKFKLAASLNGLTWDDVVDPWLRLSMF